MGERHPNESVREAGNGDESNSIINNNNENKKNNKDDNINSDHMLDAKSLAISFWFHVKLTLKIPTNLPRRVDSHPAI